MRDKCPVMDREGVCIINDVYSPPCNIEEEKTLLTKECLLYVDLNSKADDMYI